MVTALITSTIHECFNVSFPPANKFNLNFNDEPSCSKQPRGVRLDKCICEIKRVIRWLCDLIEQHSQDISSDLYRTAAEASRQLCHLTRDQSQQLVPVCPLARDPSDLIGWLLWQTLCWLCVCECPGSGTGCLVSSLCPLTHTHIHTRTHTHTRPSHRRKRVHMQRHVHEFFYMHAHDCATHSYTQAICSYPVGGM